ncbi:MAG: flagellar biosynthesis anti-sigma factor FlgM [Gammaproteobacteria bacterium]
MAIEITGQSTSQLLKNTNDGSDVQIARNDATASQEETGRPSSIDTVSLTDTATILHKAEAKVESTPVVDPQRVESIQKAIANGTFEMNSERVAEKMVNLEGMFAA